MVLSFTGGGGFLVTGDHFLDSCCSHSSQHGTQGNHDRALSRGSRDKNDQRFHSRTHSCQQASNADQLQCSIQSFLGLDLLETDALFLKHSKHVGAKLYTNTKKEKKIQDKNTKQHCYCTGHSSTRQNQTYNLGCHLVEDSVQNER